MMCVLIFLCAANVLCMCYKRFELNLKPLGCCLPGLALRKFLLTIIFIPVSPWGSTRSSCQTSNELIAAERSIFLWGGIFIYSVQCSLHTNTPHTNTLHPLCPLKVLISQKQHQIQTTHCAFASVGACIDPATVKEVSHSLFYTRGLQTKLKEVFKHYFVLLFHPHVLISLPTRAARFLIIVIKLVIFKF